MKHLTLPTLSIMGLVIGLSACELPLKPNQTTENISSKTVTTASDSISDETISDPRVAAVKFVEHINYARVALAMRDVDLAKQHVTQAHNMVTLVKGTTTKQLNVTKIESGRIVYQYETKHKYHYFPIQTDLVKIKQISNGPTWAKNNLAVTDADIVYLTVDLTGDKTEKFIKGIKKAIAVNELKKADNLLAELTDAVVTIDSRMSVPRDKARDNISLAQNFIAVKNYEGARFALMHADNALDEMLKDDVYKNYHPKIKAMRKDVRDLQRYIAKKDPTMIEKTSNKMSDWWNDLKTWSNGD